MEACSYQTSSLAWRSIIQARPIIQKGMHWAVGDGAQIRVWQDNWLLGDPQNTPTGPGMFVHPNLRVRTSLLHEHLHGTNLIYNNYFRMKMFRELCISAQA